MRTIITNATLIDCVDPTPIPNTTVSINGKRIEDIQHDDSSLPINPGDYVIDAQGRYLLPRLWVVHIHPDYHSLVDMPLPNRVTLFGHRDRKSTRLNSSQAAS